VPRYGALGLAGAYLASYSVHALTVGIYVKVHFRNHLVRPGPTVCARCDASDLENTYAH
jgi:hypothetical protein